MVDTKKRLGRGLNSLISTTRMEHIEQNIADVPEPISQPIVNKKVMVNSVADLPIEKINTNPHQPRNQWDEAKLLELSNSIKANGLVQPILVRAMGDHYQLIAGERRLRASKMAGLTNIQAIVREATEDQMLEWALIENIHRSDLNTLERAKAYQRYITEFSLTQQQAAEKLGEDRSTISNYMRLLDLTPEVQDMLMGKLITMGHARALLSVQDRHEQIELARHAVQKDWSVRELEKHIRNILSSQSTSEEQAVKNQPSPHIQELQKEFMRTIGTRVTIKQGNGKKHSGKVIIEYYNLDDFDRIRERLT